MGTIPPRPERLTGYVAALAVIGWPLAFGVALRLGGPLSWQAAALTATVVLSVWIPLRFQRGDDTFGVTIEEAVLVALLALGVGAWAGVLLGGAVLVGHVLLGSRPTKVLFNGAQVALSGGLAGLAFDVAGGGASLLSLGWFVGVAVAAAVYALAGLVAVTALFRILQGRPVPELVREVAPMMAATTAGNVLFGVLLGFLAVSDWRMLVAGIGLVALVQVGFRGYARETQDRRRTELLQATTRALVEVAADTSKFDDVLHRLTALLGGRRAELALVADGEVRSLIVHDDGAREERPLEPDSAASEALRSGSHVRRAGSDDGAPSAIAVPVVSEGQVLGALAVEERHGLEPWSDIDLGLLTSLANEAASALRTVELFEEVVRERGRYAEESRKLSDVVNATSDGIVNLGVTGRVTVWNDAMVAITGTPRAEAVGQPWHAVLRLRDADGRDLSDRQRNAVTLALQEGAAMAGLELQVMRRDGTWRWLHCTVNPVVAGDGRTTGTVLVARDVTAQHEVEELKADFLATVSHELRTPLTPLLGFVEVLDRQGDRMTPEHRAQALAAMRKQLGRLGKLVDDLLLTAQSDRATATGERSSFDAGVVVREVVDGIELGRRERLTVDVGAGLEIAGDPPGLHRIVAELVDNAMKHTTGPVRLRASRVGDEVTIAVSDDGPGIPVAEHQRVFERFGRLGDHLHRAQGPGLGLFIARSLADRLGATLELDSDEGRGSTFSLRVAAQTPTAFTARVDSA